MSIMCCIYVPEGIVMAADSRLMRMKKMQFPEKTTDKADADKIIREEFYTLTDNAQKILLLNKNTVGISYCGNAVVNGKVIFDHVQIFENDIFDTDTVQAIASKLARRKEMGNTHFFVCGYNNNIPYVYDIRGHKSHRLNVQVLDNTDIQIRYGATWAGQGNIISKIIKNEPQLRINWNLMSLRDAIDFGEFLIDSTIKYERFSDSMQTCGGDIDILVLTKDKTFWKQHKIACPL